MGSVMMPSPKTTPSRLRGKPRRLHCLITLKTEWLEPSKCKHPGHPAIAKRQDLAHLRKADRVVVSAGDLLRCQSFKPLNMSYQ